MLKVMYKPVIKRITAVNKSLKFLAYTDPVYHGSFTLDSKSWCENPVIVYIVFEMKNWFVLWLVSYNNCEILPKE